MSDKPNGFNQFDKLIRGLVRVPKEELDAAEKAERAKRQRRRKAASKKK